jgi:hypothetical protein
MKSKNFFFAVLAWTQLAISLLLAITIIWGYLTFQSSISQFIKSLAASIGAVSTVVVRTAETVEARQATLEETQKMLVVTRQLINELKLMAEHQAKLGPQYAASIKTTLATLGQMAVLMQKIGVKTMEITVPNIKIEGVKPLIVMTKPFEAQGKQIEQAGRDAKATSVDLTGISESIGRDAQKINAAFIATSDQAIKVIDETEKSLVRLKENDLPKAIVDLKSTSENLRNISANLDMLSNGGIVILASGLLLALWCMVQSLGALSLARKNTINVHT